MTDDYDELDDRHKSAMEAQRVIRERMLAGGPGWTPHKIHQLHRGCCNMTDKPAIQETIYNTPPDDPFPFDLPVDDDAIPAFLRLTAEQRAEAWKGRKLTTVR